MADTKGTGERILIAEDDNDIVAHLQDVLSDWGYVPVAAVASGEKAIEAVTETRPDLVLMDIRLAGRMSGIEAAEQIRARFDVPLIYLTAYADEKTLQQVKVTDPYGYVLKPFKLRELYTTIEIALCKHKVDKGLRESEARYRAIVEDLPVLICRFTPDGTLTFVNEAYSRYFDKTREELVGRSFVPLIPEEDREYVAARFRSLSRDNPVVTYEHRVIAPNGEIRWQRWTDRAVFEGDRLVEFQSIGEDITGQVRAEQLLQALNQAALAMAQALTPEKIFTAATEELKKLGIHCAVFLIDESHSKLSPRYLSYGTKAVKAAEKLTGLRAEGFSIPVEAVDIYRQGVWERQTVFVGNVQDIIQQMLPGPLKRFAGQIERVLKVPKAINAPLIVEGEVIGLLSVQSDDLVEDDILAITAFAHQMAAAWRRAQVFEQAQQEIAERVRAQEALRKANEELEQYAADLERRSTQLQTAAEVSRAATSTLDPDELIQQVADLVRERFKLHYVGLFLVDRAGEWTGEAGRWAVLRAGTGKAGCIQLEQGHKLEIGGPSTIGWCIANKQARITLNVRELHDVGEEAMRDHRWDNLLLPEARSELALPLVSRGQVIGAMTVHSVQEAAFGDEDITVLQTMADQVANAIESARLFEAERGRRQEAETLREAALALTTSLDRNQVVERILGQLQRVVPYNSASVQLLKGDRLEIVGGRGFPNLPDLLGFSLLIGGDNPNTEVVRTRASFIVEDGPAAYEEFRRDPHAPTGIRSWLGAPMLVGEQLVGMITLDQREPGFYTQEHARLAEAFAAQAAVAIENSRLFEAARRQAEELARLHDAAVAISSSLEPREVLRALAEQMGKALNTTSAYICDADEEVMITTVLAEWFGPEATDAERESDLDVTYPLQRFSSTRRALQERRSLIIRATDPDLDPADRESAERYGWKSYLIMPLIIRGRVLGYVELWESRQEREFTEAEVWLCQTLAADAAVAIEHARLFQAEREQRELAEALAEAAAVVSSTLDLDQVMDRILGQVERVVAGDAFNIMLIEGDNARVVGWRGYSHLGVEERPSRHPIPLVAYPSLLRMAQSGRPVVIPDTGADPNWVVKDGKKWQRSYVAAPIRIGGATAGFLNVHDTQPGQFGPADARRLEAFAHHAAIAVENARLYQEAMRRLAQAQALREAMLAAASTLDFDQVLERTCATLEATMGVEFLCFAFPDEEGEGLKLHSARIGFPPAAEDFRLPTDRSICEQVFQTKEPMMIGNVQEVPHYYEWSPQARSELVVPVRVGGRVSAILNLESRHLNAFNEEDLAFYTAIAGQLGVALENARLYQQVRHQADELAAALARLQELDRLKNEFIQNVSHELRTPLALIRGYAEMLDTGELGPLQPKQQEPVSVIARRARMLSDIVQDITLVLEAEAGAPGPELVLLDELAQAASDDFQITAEQAGLALRVEVVPHLPPVSGSPAYLRRVLDNLLSNAIKFTPAGGAVTVRVHREEDQVVLEVSDTGIGIPADQLDRIFDRFYQVDGSARRRYGGVGLGLALVKEVIEAHNGCVRVESQVGEGSTFSVTLPVHSETGF